MTQHSINLCQKSQNCELNSRKIFSRKHFFKWSQRMIRQITRFEHCYKHSAVWPDAEEIRRYRERGHTTASWELFFSADHATTARIGSTVWLPASVGRASCPEQTRLTWCCHRQSRRCALGSRFFLLADFAAGGRMFFFLPRLYVTGIHDWCHLLPVQMWSKSGQFKDVVPKGGELEATISIAKP